MTSAEVRFGSSVSISLVLVFVVFVFIFALAYPARADSPREFRPLQRGEMYDREFIDDFFGALGYRPAGLSWVDESETVRLLVTTGVQATNGRADEALATLDYLPDTIASAFPFLTTMREDLLVPEILEPWYEIDDARRMFFTFYEQVWLPHPEYRDDFMTFQEDTMGRASRRDPDVPAVWILGHLSDYGFVPDRALSQDDPYLFLWDRLMGLTYYSQRATYYGLDWDRYHEADYKRAVVGKVGEIIKAAHDEAVRRSMARTFWSQLIDRYHPFETPTEGHEATGEMPRPADGEPSSRDEEPGVEIPPRPTVSPTASQREETHRDYSELFQPPPEVEEEAPEEPAEAEIESRIEALAERVAPEEEAEEAVPEEELPEEAALAQAAPAEEEAAMPEEELEVAEEVAPAPEVEEVPEEEIPDEFLAERPELTPSEAAPEAEPPAEIGNYAMARLGEIAGDLAVHIGALAGDLGRETIDLVVLYNDVNVSEETVVNAEDRYIAKREAFLAGLAVWDRFDMEIYSPLTLADFNDTITADLRAPYEALKGREAEWAQYEGLERFFEDAFGQIEHGVRNRRSEPDVLAAESAALTAFLGEYNDMIKEIEDLLAGAITEPPEDAE